MMHPVVPLHGGVGPVSLFDYLFRVLLHIAAVMGIAGLTYGLFTLFIRLQNRRLTG